ncbi:MAG: LamG-like jellyroll fold domain-containing protein, partial [Lutibacter sp.]
TIASAVKTLYNGADLSCATSTNGQITITANGGTGTLTYSKDNGVTYQASNIFSSLAAGSYQIIVKDVNNCVSTPTAVTISAPTDVTIASAVKTLYNGADLSCATSTNGQITITANGGTGTLTYSKDNGVTYQASNIFSSLAAGSYQIIVKDVNNCVSTPTAVTISAPTDVTIASAVKTLYNGADLSCATSTNGQITITANGGTGTLTYSKDNGVTYQASNIFSSLAAGSYQIIVKDVNNCVSTLTSVTISAPSAVTINTITSNSPVCYGDSLNFTSTASGGTGTIAFNWSGPNSFTSSIQNPSIISASTLANGIYTLTVTDGNGCAKSSTVTVTVRPQFTSGAIATTGETICVNSNPGVIGSTPTASGGDGNITYKWQANGVDIASTNSATYDPPPVILVANTTYTRWAKDNTCNTTFTQSTGSWTVTVTPPASVASVTGTSPLCIGTTATYTANTVELGGGTGTWSSSNNSIATVNSSTGIVTAVSAGTAYIIYTINGGCNFTPSAQQTITVTPNAYAGTVSTILSTICIGSTTTYTVSGAILGGGTGAWSSSNTAIATVNASTGVVTAVSAGSANIIYTVTGGCSGIKNAQSSVTVVAKPVGGSISGILVGAPNPNNPSTQINPTICTALSNAKVDLTGQSGNILRWEYSVDAGLNWTPVSNQTDTYTHTFNRTTLIRTVIERGGCLAYSNNFIISVIPQADKPEVIFNPTLTSFCLNSSIPIEINTLYNSPDVIEGEGDFDNANPKGWLVDGDKNQLSGGGNNTNPDRWKLANGPKTFVDGITYNSDGKFAIVSGITDTSILDSETFSLVGSTSASLEFIQAYNLKGNANLKIEVSINGGTSWSLLEPGALHTTNYKGTGARTYGINSSNLGMLPPAPVLGLPSKTTIDLNNFIGQKFVKIRFSFIPNGNNLSSWVLDNIKIANNSSEKVELDVNGTVINPNVGHTYTITPEHPGSHIYGITSVVNNCRSAGTEGTETVNLKVSYAYIAPPPGTTECNGYVQLNAYDNTLSAFQNFQKGSYDKVVTNTGLAASPGSGVTGKWSFTGDTSCNSGFSDDTDPNAVFRGNSGNYVLTWTVGICSTSTPVTITNCSTVNFDGNNDNVNFSDYHKITGNFSLEAWVKPNALNGTIGTIISKRDNASPNSGYELYLENGTPKLRINNSFTLISSQTITTSRWYHIATTLSGTTAKMYIDGIDVTPSPPPAGVAPGNNTVNFLIGATTNGSVKTNHFNGLLQEVRIWNTALTVNQIREMMNQKIDISNANVKGTSVPLDIFGLSRSNLLGYYPMTPDLCGYLIDIVPAGKNVGKLQNMTNGYILTAPIPYTTKTGGNWNTTGPGTPWTYGDSVWDYPNSKGYNNTPIDWNIVETSHNISSGARDITLLGLISKSGELTMDGVTNIATGTGTGQGLWITHYLKLNGVIDLEGESQLVQKRYGYYSDPPYNNNYITTQYSESILDAASTGNIERDQQGQKNSFNYNYWSSPVTTQGGTNNTYSVGSILRDGTGADGTGSPPYPKPIIFGDGASFADDSPASIPIKISKRWIWSYNAPTPATNTDWQNYYLWKQIADNVPIKAGEGFSMKGTGGEAGVNVKQNYVFKGKPNNDAISLGLAIDQTYLIGNPYPSALDAREFILDNLAPIAGVNVFNGVLYFWDHFNGNPNHILAQYDGGYATLNLIGGVIATANVPLGSNSKHEGSKVPERYIPVGQGFFVNASAGGFLTFKNSQRVFKREVVTGKDNNGSVFMKTAMSKKSETQEKQETTADTRPKIRLQFDSPLGYRRPLLVGVDENATNNFDFGYDAPLNGENKEDMFWQLGQGKLVIQGVNNFNEDQELPLGIKISKAGLASIKIEALENMNKDILLFIKDKFTGKMHNISQKPFEIALEPGEYLDRFALVFRTYKLVENDVTTGVLVVDPILEDNNYHVYMNNTIAELQIKNNGTDEIRSVVLYNYLGQTMKIWNKDLNRRIISLPVKLATGVYIVRMNTINNAINKKIIIE